MKVFAFDRDDTVDVSQGPVPLSAVRELAHESGYEVWAIGNQALRSEADIPGISEARQRLVDRYGTSDSTSPWAEPPENPGRKKRLLMVEALFPDAQEYIHIDDDNVLISRRERWSYYRPKAFVTEFL